MMRIDVNCDLGEYDAAELDHPDGACARDAALMACISSANIACGAHAGDEAVMRRTLRSALDHGVAPGAHPGFADRASFGRRRVDLTDAEVHDLIAGQIHLLQRIAWSEGAELAHVKPHGALYNQAARDPRLARAIAHAVRDTAPRAILFGLAGSELVSAGAQAGLHTAAEAFADRSYEPDGSLTPRSSPDALITDPAAAAERVVRMVRTGKVECSAGHDIDVVADTICIHGDGPTAPQLAHAVRAALRAAGIRVAPPSSP